MKPSRRPLRIALIAIAAVVVIGAGTGAVLIAGFDPNTYKPDIVQAVKRATGRDLALNGRISLKPSLWPTIQVSDVTFSNPPGFSRPQMASLRGMELQLALLPLLSHRIVIERLVLIQPDILLETDAAGNPNWRMTPRASPGSSTPPASGQAAPKSAGTATDISVEAIRIQNGSLAYRDDKSGQTMTLGLPALDATAASPDAPVHVTAAALYNDIPFNLSADTGGWDSLRDHDAAWPLKLTLMEGPPGPNARPTAVTLDKLDIDAPGLDQPVKVQMTAKLHDQPFALAGVFGSLNQLTPGSASAPFPMDVSVQAAGGTTAVKGTIAPGARTAVTATVTSDRIDLDAMQGAPAPASGPPPSSPPPQRPKPQDRLFSDQPIPFDQLRAADADLTVSIGDLHSGGADYKAIQTHVVLQGGKLVVDPFAADLPGGHLSGLATIDASQPAPPIHIVLHAPGLALKTVLAAVHEPSYATGDLEIYADLHGAGDSPHAIAASLDGSLGLAIPSGTIDNRLLGSLLGKVMDTLNALDLVGKGGTSTLKCFGLRLDAEHGIGTFKALALSSSLLTMTGTGSINLDAETLAMALRPQARVAGTGVVIPIGVTGPIRHPAVKVNELGAAESNAGSVAGAVIGNATPLGIVGGLLGGDKLVGGGTADICTPALAAARGQAVPEPAPSNAKPAANNPGAMLKNLFR